MVRYTIIATILKIFSSCGPMKRLYRGLGNAYGNKKRLKSTIPSYYIERVKRIVKLCENYNLIKDGGKVIELGTGWVHWEATTIRLLYDIEATLFDVWDNRQFDAFKNFFTALKANFKSTIDVPESKKKHAEDLINLILSSSSFDDVYDLLGFKYIIETNGSLGQFKDESYDVIVSAGVLEHIKKEDLSLFVKEFSRILKPGGYSIHSINIADHLYAYDRSVSIKNYLKYSDRAWKYCYENEVQYFNRVQKSEWLTLFERAGLELVDEDSSHFPIDDIIINEKYSSFDRKDLECVSLKIVHKKVSKI